MTLFSPLKSKMLSSRPPSFLLPSSRKSDVFFTFPRPTNNLMDKVCAERLVQVIKVTARLFLEPQRCFRMCYSVPEGQDFSRKALLNRGHLHHSVASVLYTHGDYSIL